MAPVRCCGLARGDELVPLDVDRELADKLYDQKNRGESYEDVI